MVRMIANAMTFEKAMPTRVSARMRWKASLACLGARTERLSLLDDLHLLRLL